MKNRIESWFFAPSLAGKERAVFLVSSFCRFWTRARIQSLFSYWTDSHHSERTLQYILEKRKYTKVFIKKIFLNFSVQQNRYDEHKLLGVIFFDIKLSLQPDVVFDSESNDCYFSFQAPPGGEKKKFHFF